MRRFTMVTLPKALYGFGEAVRLDAPPAVDLSQLRFQPLSTAAVVQQVPTSAGMLPVSQSKPAGIVGVISMPGSGPSAVLNAPPTGGGYTSGSSGSGYATGPYQTGYTTDASGNIVPYPAGAAASAAPAASGGLGGIPTWAIIAAAGVAALLILKR